MGGNSSLMVDAVVSGNATFATPGTITVLQAIRAGADLVILGAYCNNQIAAVISKTAMAKTGLTEKSPVADKIRAMKGMTIGTNPVGATYTQMFRAYLKKYGLDPDKDVRLVGISETTALVSGIDQNRFDAIVSAAGVVEQAITLGSAAPWISGASGEIPGSEAEVVAIAIARRDTVEKNPELVKKFIAGMNDSLNALNNDRDKTGELLQKVYFNKLDPTVWKMVVGRHAKWISEEAGLFEGGFRLLDDKRPQGGGELQGRGLQEDRLRSITIAVSDGPGASRGFLLEDRCRGPGSKPGLLFVTCPRRGGLGLRICELRLQKDTGKSMIAVWCRFRSSLAALAAIMERTSEPPRPVSNPKFVAACGTLISELRIRKDTGKSMIAVWCRFRSSLAALAAIMERTSEPPHCSTKRAETLALRPFCHP